MEQCREKRIADNTLVALTLMIAESRTAEKDVMVKVVVNLINSSFASKKGIYRLKSLLSSSPSNGIRLNF